MDVSITPHDLFGTVEAIPSKSCAHRALICASLANGTTNITCPYISEDIQVTVDCLKALGTTIARTKQGFRVVPVKEQNRPLFPWYVFYLVRRETPGGFGSA